MCELKLVAVKFFGAFCFYKDHNTAHSAMCSEHAEGTRKVPVGYGGFGI